MRPILMTLTVLLTACTAQPAPIAPARADLLNGRVAAPSQACVPARPSTSLRVIDAGTLGYGSGRTIYVNRLRGLCPGLNSLSTIILDVHGTQYCSGDHFRPVEPGLTIPGQVCFLGDWVPYRRP